MTPEQRVRVTYQAFNERDTTKALAGLDPEVRWDDGEGHLLEGKQAVAEHWREQWRNADPRMQVESMRWSGLELVLLATLEARGPDGSTCSQPIRNTLRFSNDLIASMQIG